MLKRSGSPVAPSADKIGAVSKIHIVAFWTGIKAFLDAAKKANWESGDIVIELDSAGCGHHSDLEEIARDTLPLGKKFAGEMAKVAGFVNHSSVEGRFDFLVEQLTLVADGVRDGRLHPTCKVLPLH